MTICSKSCNDSKSFVIRLVWEWLRVTQNFWLAKSWIHCPRSLPLISSLLSLLEMKGSASGLCASHPLQA